MKTILTLLFVIIMGAATARTLPFDPWLEWETRPSTQGVHIASHLQDQYIIQGTRFSFDGIGVQVFRADNPLNLFNPFSTETVQSARDNVVWNTNTGQAIGFKLFSIHF